MIGKYLRGIIPILAMIAVITPARAAVMTTNVQVVANDTSTGAQPYTITYKLAQIASTLQVKIYTTGGTLIRTINSDDFTQLEPGSHDIGSLDRLPVDWDGKTDAGATAPRGQYYAEVVTTGDPIWAPQTLRSSYFTPPPGKVAGRNVYGGDANRNPSSPLHNMTYLGISWTAATGTSGVAAVSADASNRLLEQDGAAGAYDYVTASVLSDETLLLGGQAKKKLRNVRATDGSLIADYAVGQIDVRAMQSFGSGPNARVYFVDDQTPNGPLTGSIGLYNPISNMEGTPPYQTIITQAQIVEALNATAGVIPGTRGIAVNRAETAIWICGHLGTSSSTATSQFVLRFDKVGGAWQKSASWAAAIPIAPAGQAAAGYIREVALSPDETVVWVTNNHGTVAANNRVFGLNATTGADLGADFLWQPNVDGGFADFTPNGIVTTAGDGNLNANTSYNLVIAGFRTVLGAVTTANSVAIVAPMDNGSHDTTRSGVFEVVAGATSVAVTAGPSVTNITDTSATINWTTDLLSDSTVHYGGAAGVYNQPDVTSATSTSEHSITLTNLAPGVTYHFQVESRRSPLASATATGSFTTTPHIRIVSEKYSATGSSATLDFSTNVPAEATVAWGEAPDALTKTPISIPQGTAHAAQFTGLAPGATYYYTIAMTGPGAIGATTGVSAFTTAVNTGSAATVTDNDLAKAYGVNLLLSSSAATLPSQGIPGAPQTQAALPFALFDAGAVALNGYLYAIGGTDANNTAEINTAQTAVHYIKILADGSLDFAGWQTSANALPSPRTLISGMVTAYNGYVYVVGGLNGDVPAAGQATVLYAAQNPATGELGPWQGLDTGGAPINPMPAARYRGSARVADGHLVVAGGYTSGVPQGNVFAAPFRADGSLGAWFTAGTLNDVRAMNRAVANNHTVYVIGGDNAGGIYANATDVASVMPTADLTAFTRVTAYPGHGADLFDLTAGMRSMATGMVAGKIVTAGGRKADGFSGDVNGLPLIAVSKVGSDNLPGPFVNASTLNPSAVLASNLADTDGAAWNNTFYVVGGRAVASYFTTANNPATTATAEVLAIPMNPDTADTSLAAYGTIESRIIDLGAVTNLKHLTVTGANLGAATAEVRYRMAIADGVWSDWYTLASLDADISGGARYVQWQVVLKGAGAAAPSVTSATITTAAGVPGQLTVADTRRALELAAGLKTIAAGDMARLDLDANNVIDLRDATRIQRQINGK